MNTVLNPKFREACVHVYLNSKTRVCWWGSNDSEICVRQEKKLCPPLIIALYAVLYTANVNFEDSVYKLQQVYLPGVKRMVFRSILAKPTPWFLAVKQPLVNSPPLKYNVYNEIPRLKVSSYNYLGMTLDCQLNYNLHVKKLISSVSAKLKQF